jgi:YgiT-type zinc finger domain-containing protein
LKKGESNMRCPLCKGEMVRGRKTNLPYELSDERVIVVRNVPAIICSQCGDAFIEADILGKVEKILDKATKDGMILGFVEYEKAA